DEVTLRFHWHLVQSLRFNYWAFLHIRGLHNSGQDQPIGAWEFGTSLWHPGEEVRQSMTFHVPPNTAPGQYPLTPGAWLPRTGSQLQAATELRMGRRAVVIGRLNVRR